MSSSCLSCPAFLGWVTLLFILMFANCFFLDGMLRFFCSMAILNILQIQNEQVYSFYMMVNMFLFLVMSFAFLFVMSYLLGSPRPEKVVFASVGPLLWERPVPGVERRSRAPATVTMAFMENSFSRRQLRSFPSKLAVWSKAIDRRLFYREHAGQIQALITSVQALSIGLSSFCPSHRSVRQDHLLANSVKT